MNIALCIVSGIFGVLSLIAAVSQLKGEKKSVSSEAMMIGGSVLLLAAIALNIAKLDFDFVAAAAGCAGICAAAGYNGLKSGSFHPKHHIIRITLSLVLIAGFIFL